MIYDLICCLGICYCWHKLFNVCLVTNSKISKSKLQFAGNLTIFCLDIFFIKFAWLFTKLQFCPSEFDKSFAPIPKFDDRFARQNRYGPPPEFPLTSSYSNHQPHHCLLNRLFRRRSKKTSKLRVTGLCAGKSPETGESPAQTASNAENVSFHDVIMKNDLPHWYKHAQMTCSQGAFKEYPSNMPANMTGRNVMRWMFSKINTPYPP